MKIFELLRNPIVKLIGAGFVLYFALFANKENPDSLGNRWSKQQLQKDIEEAKIKSHFIITNVKIAKETAKELDKINLEKISIEDLEEGNGEEKISCGDAVQISYGIYTSEGTQLEFIESENLTIGSKNNELLEKNLIGMKKGGARNIKVSHDFQTTNKKLADLLKFHATDLKYQITALSIIKNASPQTICQ